MRSLDQVCFFSLLLALPAQAANVNYQVNVARLRHFEGGTFGNCWESGDEEYTGKVWARDNVDTGETGGTCYQSTYNGNVDYAVNANIRSRTATAATEVIIRLQAYEDDGGDRCSFDSGDDCHYQADVATISFRNQGQNTWTTYGWFGNSDHGVQVSLYWEYTTPATPVAASATSIGSSGFTANWASAANATDYRLDVSTNSSFSSFVSGYQNLAVSGTSHNIIGVASGTTYYYRVRAINNDKTSGNSATISLTTTPAAPGGVSASDGTQTNFVRVTWNAAAGATAGYLVYRHTINDPGSATLLTPTPISQTSYDDISVGGAPPLYGVTYYYWVKARNSISGDSSFSASDAGFHGLGAPTGVSATDGSDPDKIVITWNKVAVADGYKIYRNTTANSATASLLATLNGNSTLSYHDTSAAAAGVYYYWLKSTLGAQVSAFSAYDDGQRSVPVPTGVSASDGLYKTKIEVQWNAVPIATGYQIFRSPNTTPPSSPLATVGAVTLYSDTSAVAGNTYYYWVKALAGVRHSDLSVDFDFGSLGVGESVSLPISVQGSVKNSSSLEGTPFVGYKDNTWPASNDYWRAYFWWNSSAIPAGVAIEKATISYLGYAKTDYQDDEWFDLRAAKLATSRSAWDGAGAGTRDSWITSIDGASPRYLNLTANQGNSYNQNDITVDRAHLADLRNGNFGLGFNFTDKSGGSGDDSTKCTARAGAINLTYYPNPGLAAPPDGATVTSGTVTDLRWNAAMPDYSLLRFRVQVSRQSNFSSLLYDGLVSDTRLTIIPIDLGTTYWRVRIEDPHHSSNASQWATRSFFTPAPPIPEPPAAVNARDGTSTSAVRVSWASAAYASSYEVYRATTNHASGSLLLGSTTQLYYDDTSAAPGTVYFYWVKSKNSSGTSGFSVGDPGYRASGGTNTAAISSSGSIWYDHDGDYGTNSNPYFGWVDNTFPVDDDHYIGYFWWNTSGVPATAAIEQAVISSLGFTRANYQDSDWSYPRAGRILSSKSSFDGANTQAKWSILSAVYSSEPRYLTVNANPGPTYAAYDIVLDRSHLLLLNNGQQFGIAFDSQDTSGDPTDDSSQHLATAGTLETAYLLAPTPTSPANGASFASNTTVGLAWNGSTVYSPYLRNRVQVAKDAGFSQLVFNTLTGESSQSILLIDGATYYWRVRVEDKDNPANASSWSASRNFIVTAPPHPPTSPTYVQASDGLYVDQVQVSWPIVSLASSYEVWRAASNNSNLSTKIGETNTNVYADTSAVTSTVYYYWIKAKNSAGASGFSPGDSGFRGIDFGVTKTCNLVWDGAIENDTVYGYSELADPRFGLDDGSLWNTWYRAFLWWDTSSIPAGVAVDRATFSYLGFIADNFSATTEKTPRAIKIGVDYQSFSSASLENKYLLLNATGQPEDPYLRQATSNGQAFYTYDIPVVRGHLPSLAGQPRFGLAFGSDEDDNGTVEDTSIFQAKGGTLTVTYYATPALHSPATAATFASGLTVTLEWNAVLSFGRETYLRYRIQVARDAGFTNLFTNKLQKENVLGLTQLPDDQTYYWRVRIEDAANANNASAWSPVRHFIVPLPAPTSPQAFVATDGEHLDQVALSWSAVFKAASYTLYRSTSNNFATAAVLASGLTGSSYQDTTAALNTRYYYFIRAFNSAGASPVSASEIGYRGIAAPSGLTASDGSWPDRIRLTWNAVSGAASYEIWRSGQADPAGAVRLAILGAVTTYDDTGATPGQNYFYQVKAANQVATSAPSNSDSGYFGLAPPLNLSASDGSHLEKIVLTWSAVQGADGYKIFRSPNPSLSSALLLAEPTGTYYHDTSAEPATAYTYWVMARSGLQSSAPSQSDSGYRGLAAPTGLAATDGAHPDRVALSWNSVVHAAGYHIFRTVSNDPSNLGNPLTTLTSPSTVTWADQTAAAGQRFYYWVRAFHAAGPGNLSASDSGFLAPSGLAASDGVHLDKVTLEWSPAYSAIAYQVFRHTSDHSASAAQIGTVNASTLAFTDTSAAVGTVYYYWVRAQLPSGLSGFSLSDVGNRGNGGKVVLPVSSSGSIRDGEEQLTTAYLGWVDNTWPASDDEYRAYFWWNTAPLPAGTAIERATIDSITYTKNNYADDEWSAPRARRIPVSKNTFDTGGNSARFNWLSAPAGEAAAWSVASDRGNSATTTEVRVEREDFQYLKNGQQYGLGFQSLDTTGSSGDDSTRLTISTGGLTVHYYGAPALLTPAPAAALPSGSTVELSWTPVFAKNPFLLYRVQVASTADFAKLLVNQRTLNSNFTFGPATACGTVYYWRVRVEDIALEDTPLADLENPIHNFSAWTAPRSFSLTPPPNSPSAPSWVEASQGSFDASVRLLWEEVPYASSYDILRHTSDQPAAATPLVSDLAATVRRYFDLSAVPGTTYYYWVRAKNCLGQSTLSPYAAGFVQAIPAGQYFPQSVLSGSPAANSVVVWTRVHDPARPDDNYTVGLEVASDPTFQQIVYSRNNLQARALHDHCLKHKVTGLQPYTYYWYRFRYFREGDAGVYLSKTGRTKTLPAIDMDVPVKFSYLSCQDYVGKYYNTLADLTNRYQDSLDFIIYIGDYIYETTGNPEFQSGSAERSVHFTDTAGAIDQGGFYAAKSLSNYRELYKTYRSDPMLQRLHELFPMFITWDDHEFSDDNHGATASYMDEKLDEYDPVRKRNSEQAFLEYHAVDFGLDAFGVAVSNDLLFPNLREIYSNLRVGRHAEILITDYRQYRPDHLIPESAFPGEIIMTEQELKDTLRQMNGWNQAQLDAQWPSLRTRYDPYDPNFNADSTFGLAVQAAVIYMYTEEGLSLSEATGRAKEVVKSGRMSASLVNVAAQLSGIDIGYSEAEYNSFPRGLSYMFLAKVPLFGPIGSRYAVIYDNFNTYAYYRYQLSGGATENVYGDEQTQWIQDTLSASDATWKLFINSVSFTPMIIDIPTARSMVEITIPDLVPSYLLHLLDNRVMLNADAWDGFPNKKKEILNLLGEHNAIILSGDIHSSWITRHIAPNGKVVPEFTGTSVSSGTVEGLFTDTAAGYPMVADLVDLDAMLPLIKPIFLKSAQYANTRAEILDAALGSNGYLVVELDSRQFRVVRHEIAYDEVKESYYDPSRWNELSSQVTVTTHTVTRKLNQQGRTESLQLDDTVAPQRAPIYNRLPTIAQGAAAQLTISQNNNPVAFSLTLNAVDEDGDVLTWSILSPPQYGAATVGDPAIGPSQQPSYVPASNFIGNDSFVVRVQDGRGGYDDIAVQVTIQPGQALDRWLWETFGFVNPSEENTVWGPLADPDGDGRTNFFEYAFGFDPVHADFVSDPLVGGISRQGNQTYLTLSFKRRKNQVDPTLQYQVELLENGSWRLLESGEFVVESSTTIDDRFEQTTFRLTSPLTSGPGRIVRVRVRH